MNTTGRSEGVNAFFNEFVSPKTNLTEFVVRYEQALKKIVERKSLEDYVSEHKDRIIDENNLILKHGAKVYTRNIFEKFREELVDSIRFKCEEGERSGDFNTYVVTAKVGYPKQFNLKMKPGTYEGYCECKYFEFIGLPCKHVLRTLNKLGVDEIPPDFILKKWMKGSNSFRVMDELPVSDIYECSEAFRLSHLCRRSTQMSCVASKSDELYKMAIKGIEGLFTRIMDEHNKMVKCDKTSQEISTLQEDIGAEKLCQIFVQDPRILKIKGRPKKDNGKGKISSTGRLKSSIELSSSQRQRKCTIC
ncbi:zinc finger protein [Macleaya cordata]|uniref:Protein FAR1-RELATED SEQUENCE n=1 Tax=Macleaya cordata TaxID=56857 RepID=A0A200QWX4_MACCD|nr:zinc finger protein [Macleaya cordata]